MASIVLIVSIRMSGVKVSLKSIPGYCEYPFTTNWALYIWKESSSLYLIL